MNYSLRCGQLKLLELKKKRERNPTAALTGSENTGKGVTLSAVNFLHLGGWGTPTAITAMPLFFLNG